MKASTEFILSIVRPGKYRGQNVLSACNFRGGLPANLFYGFDYLASRGLNYPAIRYAIDAFRIRLAELKSICGLAGLSRREREWLGYVGSWSFMPFEVNGLCNF